MATPSPSTLSETEQDVDMQYLESSEEALKNEGSMIACDTSSDESVLDSLSNAIKRLHRDLDNVCHNVCKIQGFIKTLENNNPAIATKVEPMKEELSQIRCKVDSLSGSHRNMQKSVDTVQEDIDKMKDDMTAMHVQLDELSNVPAGGHESNRLVQETNQTVVSVGLEQRSTLINGKSDDDKKWYFTDHGDFPDVIKKLKEQITQQETKIKDLELLIDTHNHEQADQSLLEQIKDLLKNEMEEIPTNPMNPQHQSQDSGQGSLVLGTNIIRQMSDSNTSLGGVSTQQTFATQQSYISSASSISSIGESESPISNNTEPFTKRPNRASSGIQFDIPESALIPNIQRSSTDPTVTYTQQSCNGCNQRINRLITSLHRILETHINQNISH